MSSDARMRRIAVVGSGPAGLITAYLLQHDHHSRFQVHVFENGPLLSLDSASVALMDSTTKEKVRIDLPMRSMQGGFYSHLKSMYDYLRVPYQPQRFNYGFARSANLNFPRCQPDFLSQIYFMHSSNNHSIVPLRSSDTSTVAWIWSLLYTLYCYLYFQFCCNFRRPRESTASPGHAPDQGPLSETLNEWLKRVAIPTQYVHEILLPIMSCVSTCPHMALLDSPARDIVEYVRLTSGTDHYLISGGVQQLEEILSKGVDVKLNCRVMRVEYQQPESQASKVQLQWQNTNTKEQHTEEFDHVVLAVSPDIVGRIFPVLQKEMAQIPTMSVSSMVHDRGSMMFPLPHDHQVLRSSRTLEDAQYIHLVTSQDGDRNPYTTATQVHSSDHLVTTYNYPSQVEHISTTSIHKTVSFTRVLRTPISQRIINSIFHDFKKQPSIVCDDRNQEKSDSQSPIYRRRDYNYGAPKLQPQSPNTKPWQNGDGGVWLTGGWCWDGLVLLEGCVRSAELVAQGLECEVPW